MVKLRKDKIELLPVDSTAWLFDNDVVDFLVLNTHEIKYMCMLCYTFLHGYKLFPTLPNNSSPSFKYVSMIMQCTGGGTLVPVFVNTVPVALAMDAYPVAITVAFLIHMYLPIMREIYELSNILRLVVIVMYEAFRASVVVKLTKAAATNIAPSDFSFAVFGPIFCGAIAGCGGAFLPLNKGLDPIKQNGLAQPMLSSLIGAMFYHLFLSTSLSNGVMNAPKKAHAVVAAYFILYHLYLDFGDELKELLPKQVQVPKVSDARKRK